MSATRGDDLADLVADARAGRPGSQEALVEALYRDFRRIAARRMRRERSGHTLQPTALAHEALARILGDGTLDRATDRSFLHRAASRAMNRVLIDHQRRRDAGKGPGRLRRSPLEAALDHLSSVEDLSLSELREALEDLARIDPRAGTVVQFRFFLGMSRADVAEALGISQKTVKRSWSFARGWLFERLKPQG